MFAHRSRPTRHPAHRLVHAVAAASTLVALLAAPSCRITSAPDDDVIRDVTFTFRALPPQTPPGGPSFSIAGHTGYVRVGGTLTTTCAPYRVMPVPSLVGSLLTLRLVGQVTGAVCPLEIVETLSFEAVASRLSMGSYTVEVWHEADSGGAAVLLGRATVDVD